MEPSQIQLHTLLAILVSWVTGSLLVSIILGKKGDQNWAIRLGYGYLLGLVITTLFLRLFSGLGIKFDYLTLVALHLTLAAALVYYRRRLWLESISPEFTRPRSVFGYELIGITLLLMLIGLRYGLLLEEVLLRPVFAWDAWMNWSPRAIVWFEQGYIAPFVERSEWLNQSAQQEVYVLANPWTGWDYPVTIPLIQVWTMLAVGETSANPGFLAWWFLPISIALCFYGHLRLWGMKTLPILILTYLFLSLPYLNIHTALSGYADIWLAAAFVMMALSMQEWKNTNNYRYLLMSLLFAAICTQLKNPGLILGAFFLPVYFLSESKISYRWKVLALCLTFIGLITVVTVGIRIQVPVIGLIELSKDMLQLPLTGQLKFEFNNVSGALADSLFRMSNWHLLFYLMVGSIVLGLFRPGRRARFSSPLFLFLVAGTAFILLVFYFTRHSAHAEDFRTLNRAVLYFVPLVTITLWSMTTLTGAPQHHHTEKS